MTICQPSSASEVEAYIEDWIIKDSAIWHVYINGYITSDIITNAPQQATQIASPIIDLNQYINVTFSGADLVGTATVTFDRERFLLDNYGKVAFNDNNLQVYKEYYGFAEESPASAFLNFVSVDLSKTNNLSNGDKVQAVWNLDEGKINTYFTVKYLCPTKTFTVSGLEKGATFDPFENVQIQYSGIAPYATASCYSYDYYGGSYTVSPNKNLKNGSKVKVTYTCEDKTYMLEHFGAYPSSYEKTYTVSGLSSYAKSINEIPDNDFDQMISVAASEVYVDGYGSYPDASYCGNYFFNIKGDINDHYASSGGNLGNMILMVFAHPANWYDDSTTVYSVIKLENILIDANGRVSYNGYFDNIDRLFYSEAELKELANEYKSYMKCTDNLMLG